MQPSHTSGQVESYWLRARGLDLQACVPLLARNGWSHSPVTCSYVSQLSCSDRETRPAHLSQCFCQSSESAGKPGLGTIGVPKCGRVSDCRTVDSCHDRPKLAWTCPCIKIYAPHAKPLWKDPIPLQIQCIGKADQRLIPVCNQGTIALTASTSQRPRYSLRSHGFIRKQASASCNPKLRQGLPVNFSHIAYIIYEPLGTRY